MYLHLKEELPMQNTLLPVYLVLDTSASMFVEDENGGNAFDAAINFLSELYEELTRSASLANALRVEVITFNEKTAVPIPLADMEQLVENIEKLKENPIVPDGNHTYYGEAFRTLRTEIEKDAQQLQNDGYEVHRPVAFLITGGEPNDDDSARNKSYSELTTSSFSYRPNLICVGVGKATKKILEKYGASRYKYDEYTTGNEHMVLVPHDGITPVKAVQAIIPVLISGIQGGKIPSKEEQERARKIFDDIDFDDLDDWA
jgi:uncharacterized protein YegL